MKLNSHNSSNQISLNSGLGPTRPGCGGEVFGRLQVSIFLLLQLVFRPGQILLGQGLVDKLRNVIDEQHYWLGGALSTFFCRSSWGSILPKTNQNDST